MAEVKKENLEQQDFDKFREQIHPQQEQGRPVVPKPHGPVAIAFGIFMIIVYVGVGILFLINFFNWEASWIWARYFIGILLIIYGVYRGYRQFSGKGYY